MTKTKKKVTKKKKRTASTKSGGISISRAGSFFDTCKPHEVEGCEFRLAIAGYHVTPRDERFQYYLDWGMANVENVLNHKPLSGNLVFVFPERWLSVHEQRMFLHELYKHPSVKDGSITSVYILTQNPLIAGNATSGSINMLTWDTGSRGLANGEHHPGFSG